MDEKELWDHNIKDWRIIRPETAKLMIDQADLALKETLDTDKTITGKAEKLLPVLITLISTIVIYIFRGEESITSFEKISAVIALIPLMISFIYTLANVKPKKIKIIGTYPEHLVRAEYIDDEILCTHPESEDPTFEQKNLQYVNMVIGICRNTQQKIKDNDTMNIQRAKYFEYSLYWLSALPLCALLGALIAGAIILHGSCHCHP